MLEHAWLIPAITFASFWLILFFGKRLPFKGSEIGLFAVGLCLVLSIVAGAQWINHKSVPVKEEGRVEAVASGDAAHETEMMRETVDYSVHWFKIGGVQVDAGTHIDGLAIVMLFTVSVISFLVPVFSTHYMA